MKWPESGCQFELLNVGIFRRSFLYLSVNANKLVLYQCSKTIV